MGYYTDRQKKPDNLTDEFQEKFVELIRSGVPIRTACFAMRTTPETIMGWLNWGKDPDTPTHDFFLAVMGAEADGEIEMIQAWRKLNTSGKVEWRSLQNYLERRYRNDWAAPTEVNVNVQHQHTITKVELAQLNDNELQQFLDRAEANRKLLEAKQQPKALPAAQAIIDVVAETSSHNDEDVE